MKKILLLSIGVVLFLGTSQNIVAQDMATSVYKKEHIKNRKPIPYPMIREADVIWSKLVWRTIDLREKMNLSLYYPVTPQDDRYSLVDLLLYGIENEGLTAYDTEDDEFRIPMTMDQIREKFDALNDTITRRNQLTGELEEVIIAGEIHSDEIKRFIVKEQWLFDKQTSTLRVHIIGLCPIREYFKEDNTDMDEVQQKKVFWVYFPEARPLLATHEVFNPHNDAARYSYDDLFMKRRFSSFITQVSNEYNNRSIFDYTEGIQSMLEAERIKNDIFNFEHDLWEF